MKSRKKPWIPKEGDRVFCEGCSCPVRIGDGYHKFHAPIRPLTNKERKTLNEVLSR